MNHEAEAGLTGEGLPFEGPDPSLYIDRLDSDDPFQREAAAWSLGCMGHPRANRPLAGLLLREIRTIGVTGAIEHEDIVRAAVDSIRRLGATESLYAIIRSLCAMGCCDDVERETVEELVECLAEVGGFNVVREATDKVVRHAREHCPHCRGLETVAMVLFERLAMCGDAGVRTLRRLSNAGPEPLRPLAAHALSMV
jgi:HEAT repeat protein